MPILIKIGSAAKAAKRNRQSYSTYIILVYITLHEELGGRAVSALGVRSRKLSTGLNGQSWDG
jgi:hypothetical protein